MTVFETGVQPLAVMFSLVAEAEGPPEVSGDDLERLASHVLQTEGATGAWEITVAFVDDARLQALHHEFMGIDAPTDIMTFPVDDSGDESHGGALVISVDQARTQADAWGLSPADEIRFLVIHGLLHLLGWRDDSGDERSRMLDRQQTILDDWRAG